MTSPGDPLDFTGRTVLVVGGSSGIGNGIARAFLDRGAMVHVWGTRASANDYDPADGCDLTGLEYVQVDVEHPETVAAAPGLPRLDVLVLAQGTVIYRRGEFEMAGFAKVIDVNLNSMMACAMKFREALAVSGGALITVSSTSAYHATRGNPAYTASKAGVVALTRTLAQAWAAAGIRVNGIAPGLVDTKLTKVTTEDPRRLAGALASIPLKRLGEPADMAGAALFLASSLSAYVLGQTLIVDGGLTLS